MNPQSLQWQKLASRAIERQLEPEEMEQLVTVCRESHEARQALARALIVERLMPLAMHDPTGEYTAQEAVLRIEQDASVSVENAWRAAELARKWLWQVRFRKAAAVAAVLTVLCVSALWLASWIKAPASVMRSEGMSWVGGIQPELNDGELPRGQRLQGESGLLEVAFKNGARLVLEAPFDIEMKDNFTLILRHGRVSVRCPETAHGFTVRTDFGDIVDLGTEFCVSKPKDGKLEVHVLEGTVQANLKGLQSSVLFKNEALRTDGATLERMAADFSAFITAMPDPTSEPVRYVHWSFDELEAGQFADHGNGLGNGVNTRLYLRQFKRGKTLAEPPAITEGAVKQGLFFNGTGAFAETPFLGIGGKAPRTVALWVKIPKDMQPHEGHGIVSWGTITGPTAWQLSANSRGDGPIGCLRIGTYDGGCVIGSTDLRDDQWHHVAVVMYGGNNPTLSTNVLLYVDGKKEAVSRKTLTEIYTDVLAADHGIWLGRDITYTAQAAKTPNSGPGRFFRGHMDEVYIFNTALSQQDIRRLMNENQVPPFVGKP